MSFHGQQKLLIFVSPELSSSERDYMITHSVCMYVAVGGSRQKFWQVRAAQVFKNRVSGTDFFGLKLGSLEQIFAKICVSGAKNRRKMVLKCKIFSKNSSGVSEAGERLKKMGLPN